MTFNQEAYREKRDALNQLKEDVAKAEKPLVAHANSVCSVDVDTRASSIHIQHGRGETSHHNISPFGLSLSLNGVELVGDALATERKIREQVVAEMLIEADRLTNITGLCDRYTNRQMFQQVARSVLSAGQQDNRE